MPYSAEGYRKRAEECVRLAHMANDDMIRASILRLRQSYLEVARNLESEMGQNDDLPRRN